MGKKYLGDGVYVDYDGFNVVLTTENGVEEGNRIVLEPSVKSELNRYINDLNKEILERQEIMKGDSI